VQVQPFLHIAVGFTLVKFHFMHSRETLQLTSGQRWGTSSVLDIDKQRRVVGLVGILIAGR
jgi:hypothetical protein